MLARYRLLAVVAMLPVLLLMQACQAEVFSSATPKEKIVFGDLSWDSALIQNRVAQYVTEFGYGYPTGTIPGETIPLFEALRRGETHVAMEVWIPNQNAAWDEARAAGEILSVGTSLGNDWQSAFVIPGYLQEQYPDLDHVDDLKSQEYKDLFPMPGTGNRARLVSCVVGWSCEPVNDMQVEGYGLSDHVEIVHPDDSAQLNADLQGAYDSQEPWLGYQWGTNDTALQLDLVRLDEPAYSDECWYTTRACAYEDATILIAVDPDLLTRAPGIVAMLRKWDFNIDVYKSVVQWRGNNVDAGVNETALWWLNNNADIWGRWVTPEASAAIEAALEADRVPKGWPAE